MPLTRSQSSKQVQRSIEDELLEAQTEAESKLRVQIFEGSSSQGGE